MAADSHLTRSARRKRANKPRVPVSSILPPRVRLGDIARIETDRTALDDEAGSLAANLLPYPVALRGSERGGIAEEHDNRHGPASVPEELDLSAAVESFGDERAACGVLSLLVQTVRSELPDADRLRRKGEWKKLSEWVHRTHGAVALFGDSGLLALGEAFERHALASRLLRVPLYDAFLLALGTWLNAAEARLARSASRDRP